MRKGGDALRGAQLRLHSPRAQGRVWSGKRALEVGLVDALGGLSRAVAIAKRELKIPDSEDVRLVELSREMMSPLQLLSGGGASLQALAGLVLVRLCLIWLRMPCPIALRSCWTSDCQPQQGKDILNSCGCSHRQSRQAVPCCMQAAVCHLDKHLLSMISRCSCTVLYPSPAGTQDASRSLLVPWNRCLTLEVVCTGYAGAPAGGERGDRHGAVAGTRVVGRRGGPQQPQQRWTAHGAHA